MRISEWSSDVCSSDLPAATASVRAGGGLMSTSKTYFTGPFAPMCDAFVTQMRSLGRAYKQQAMLLRMFDNFSKGYRIQGFTITEELASAWSKKRPSRSENRREGKECVSKGRNR